jgi:hypothetical protein
MLANYEIQVAEIRAKIQVLDEVLEGQKKLTVEGANGGVAAPEALPEGLTDAALWIVNKYGKSAPVGMGEIKAHLSTHGYSASGKNYTGILSITLKRLRESKRVQAVKTGIGNWLYRPAN